MKPFVHYHQLDSMDCGPTCLRMIAKHYGRSYAMPTLRERAEIGKEGVSLLGISQAAESIGFRTLVVQVPLARLIRDTPVPFVAHWGQNHFVVVYQFRKGQVRVADPASGLVAYTVAEFESRWATTVEDGERCGIALLLEPTPTFYAEPGEAAQSLGMGRLLGYLQPHTRLIGQLLMGLQQHRRQRREAQPEPAASRRRDGEHRAVYRRLPLRYNTKIGAEGNGVSQGQRQRLLIARAVYKDPTYLFLDEATNAFDANNERVIIDKLNEFFEGKTVLVVAHRLSTVRNADQIVVLEQGEVGTHDELTRQRGRYFELVRNQLEL
jgi:ABC-type bacteriocin/lantibiotic exporter with double-glycine peptidase domain